MKSTSRHSPSILFLVGQWVYGCAIVKKIVRDASRKLCVPIVRYVLFRCLCSTHLLRTAGSYVDNVGVPVFLLLQLSHYSSITYGDMVLHSRDPSVIVKHYLRIFIDCTERLVSTDKCANIWVA